MKRIIFFQIIFLGISFIALAQNNSRTMPPARSESPNIFQVMPITFFVFDCDDNPIEVSGNLVLMVHWPPAGQNQTLRANLRFSGLSGSNTVTGERYHLMEHQMIIIRLYASGNAFVISSLNKIHLVGQKTGTSLFISHVRHIAVHPDQTWDTVVDQEITKCDGEPANVSRL